MKEKIIDFLKDNCIVIPVYISLLFIGLIDSTIALVVYLVLIHGIILLFIAGLCMCTIVNKVSYKQILVMFVESLIILTIIGMRKHWYTFDISCLCIFLSFVHAYNARKTFYRNKRFYNFK